MSYIKCCKCGLDFEPQGAILSPKSDGSFNILCPHCALLFGHCHTCTKAKTCSFEQSNSSHEPFIMQEIRHGNSIIRQRVKNPERVRETCQKDCKCFSEEFGCLRQINQTCGNYEEEE